jgi:NSS family neurotransmitter:Na+ symporter
MGEEETSVEMEVARETWVTRMGFVFAVWGSMTGLGNVWNWPFKVSVLGGGPFVLIYLVMLALVGIPVVLTEFVLGSTFRRGFPGALKRIHPLGEFLGWFCLVNTAILTAFYTVLISYAAVYAGYALTGLTLDGPMGAALFTDQPNFFVNMLMSPIVLIGLIVIWLVVFMIDYFGTRGIERSVMILFPLMWIIIIFMAFFGLSQPGAAEGLNFYLDPAPEEFINPQMWSTAVSLSFFKLSAGMGALTAYASYLPRRGEITNSAITTSLLDTTFAFTAGMAVFTIAATAGFLGSGGVGFAFVAWPGGMTIPGGNILGFVFFLMMVFLGVTSAISLVEAIVTAVMDKFGWPRSKTVIVITLILLLGGVPFTLWMDVTGFDGTMGDVTWGLYLLDIFDYYVENFGLVLVTLFMMIIMAWVWGGSKILDAANEAGDFKLPGWYKWVVKVISPIGIIVALAFIILNGFYAVGSFMEFTAPLIWIAICVVFAFILYRMKGVD